MQDRINNDEYYVRYESALDSMSRDLSFLHVNAHDEMVQVTRLNDAEVLFRVPNRIRGQPNSPVGRRPLLPTYCTGVTLINGTSFDLISYFYCLQPLSVVIFALPSPQPACQNFATMARPSSLPAQEEAWGKHMPRFLVQEEQVSLSMILEDRSRARASPPRYGLHCQRKTLVMVLRESKGPHITGLTMC